MNKKDIVRIHGWDIDSDELMQLISDAAAEAMTHPGFTAGVILDTRDGSLSINSCGNGVTEAMRMGIDVCIWSSDNYEYWSPFLDWHYEDAREECLRDALGDETVDAYLDDCDDDERRDALLQCYNDNRGCVDEYIIDHTDVVNDMVIDHIDLDYIAKEANSRYAHVFKTDK